MLRSLSIKNIALVDNLKLEFDPGMTVITGETGAGKSVLVKQNNGSFEKKVIKIGMTSGSDVEVVSGLKEGEIVSIKRE